jgi:putative transcriptional regulator
MRDNKISHIFFYFLKFYKTFCKIYLTNRKYYVTICHTGGGKLKNLKLKLARVAMDLSQEDLANAVGVTRQTINMIEKGNYNPSLNLCISICKALNKTLDQLFWEEENNEKN